MPEHRNPISTVAQVAPIRLALDTTSLDIEVVSSDGAPIGRPCLVGIECDGQLVGWRIAFDPPMRVICDRGSRRPPGTVEAAFRRLTLTSATAIAPGRRPGNHRRGARIPA
jgi:hypothetical protein